MSQFLKSGKVWPYAIGFAIIAIFGACVATVIVANKLPVAKSDTYMMGYHEADAKANELIKARIAFDKKYNIEYITEGLSQENTVLKYKLTDKSGKAINDAKITVVITRPNNHTYDQELVATQGVDGIYTFEPVKLAVAGRWDIMAKVEVGDVQRYYNLKADTRSKDAYEY